MNLLFDYCVIRPTSFLYGLIASIRRGFFEYGFAKREKFTIPMISVGNLSFGGAGKTPLTIWILEYVQSLDLIPCVLTRGYKGKREKKRGILKASRSFTYDPFEYGDEPVLLAQALKAGAVVVGKKRAKNLSYYYSDIKPDIGILDDGFQHLGLARDLNIVVFNALLPLERYYPAPRGYLREDIETLRFADLLVINHSIYTEKKNQKEIEEFIQSHLTKKLPLVHMCYEVEKVVPLSNEGPLGLDSLRGRKIIPFIGVANPDGFITQLKHYGSEIQESMVFPDHYSFTLEDVEKATEASLRLGAWIVMTEKDSVKLKRLTQNPHFFYLPLKVKILEGEDVLKTAIRRLVGKETLQ